ncbi:winged helix-turn-helix domain-containing protein [Rheinheimera sp. 1928-s]|uniref:winged helix-turn-helix domain-containing protein n=1 Tax=Rheinheimera sp. 1928-s TaxID=3033803 RepID=UPI002612BB8C|nr:winged helix-turn-helix domain-containing protein [Rheinheimera sp. 1928-s]MDF3125393.1 winged helix-turn-helix domain-containing protein [Rheinheimera sp. 1928-s]
MDKMQLGPWTFTPGDYSIRDKAQRIELEPLLSKLLHYFIEHPGKIISRQQLVDAIWQQSYVDDNAINRAMSELRKALQHPDVPQSLIKTHHRKGYSLQLPHQPDAPIEPSADEKPKTSAGSTQYKRSIPLWLVALATLLLVGTAAVYYFSSQKPASLSKNSKLDDKPQVLQMDIVTRQKITWFKGIESRPLLSADKQLLAYSHSQPDGTVRAIVRKLGMGTGSALQEVVIEGNNSLYSIQTWQPLSRNLLVQAISKDGQRCEYQNYDFSKYPQYQVKTLTSCAGLNFGTAQQSADGQWLYYSKGSGGLYSSNALLAENLTTGAVQTLLAAPSAGLGVTMLALSADGSKLAYILMPESNKPDIYIYDPSSREHTRLASLPFPLILLGLDWSNDQSSLILPGGDGILQLKVADKTKSLLKFPEGVIVGELTLLAEDQAYISSFTAGSASQNAMQLIKIEQPFNAAKRKITVLSDTEGSTADLAVSPIDSSSYAFSANWTGSWQLWMNNKGQNVQLTELTPDDKRLSGINWSGDGRYIAFNKQGNLHLYDTQRQQLINKLESNDVGQAVWLPDNSGLVLTRLQGNSQNLWQLDLVSNELTQLTFSAGTFAQFDAQGQLHYHRDGKLLRYVDGGKNDIELKTNADTNFMALWLLQGQKQYRFGMLGHLELHDIVTGETQSSQLPYQLLAIHPDPHNPDQLYATVFVTPELALEFIQWKPKR